MGTVDIEASMKVRSTLRPVQTRGCLPLVCKPSVLAAAADWRLLQADASPRQALVLPPAAAVQSSLMVSRWSTAQGVAVQI